MARWRAAREDSRGRNGECSAASCDLRLAVWDWREARSARLRVRASTGTATALFQ